MILALLNIIVSKRVNLLIRCVDDHSKDAIQRNVKDKDASQWSCVNDEPVLSRPQTKYVWLWYTSTELHNGWRCYPVPFGFINFVCKLISFEKPMYGTYLMKCGTQVFISKSNIADERDRKIKFKEFSSILILERAICR